MANIFGPILPLQLDSRNTEALVRAIQTRIYLESDGQLTDFTPASPLAAISEGQAFAQAELLYYLNNLPEAFSLQWLRQLGIQRKLGSKSLVNVTFYKVPGFQRTLIVPSGTKLFATAGQTFITLEEVRISETDFLGTVICQSESWGSAYNVGEGQINKIEKNFAGLEFLRNETPAQGGTDIESVTQMKQRAFEVLTRRNLTTAIDFENEVRTLVPESSIVKILTYEERNSLDEALSGNLMICLGDEDGKELEAPSLSFLIDSIKSRVTIGTNVSLISPEIIPLDVVIEIRYDPLAISVGTDVLSNQVFEAIRAYFDPRNLPLGSDINYQEVAKRLYEFDFVQSINTLDVKAMIRSSAELHGPCAGFSGQENEDETKCFYNYSAVVSSDFQTLESPSPITSYKLFKAEIGFTSINDFSSLTFFYDNLYRP
jgi:uncharacterized phage protein gp47/JayE